MQEEVIKSVFKRSQENEIKITDISFLHSGRKIETFLDYGQDGAEPRTNNSVVTTLMIETGAGAIKKLYNFIPLITFPFCGDFVEVDKTTPTKDPEKWDASIFPEFRTVLRDRLESSQLRTDDEPLLIPQYGPTIYSKKFKARIILPTSTFLCIQQTPTNRLLVPNFVGLYTFNPSGIYGVRNAYSTNIPNVDVFGPICTGEIPEEIWRPHTFNESKEFIEAVINHLEESYFNFDLMQFATADDFIGLAVEKNNKLTIPSNSDLLSSPDYAFRACYEDRKLSKYRSDSELADVLCTIGERGLL